MTFKNLRVLELGDDPALSYGCLQLARWGAQVAVGMAFCGDLPRRAPRTNGESLMWRYLSANKWLVEEGLAELATDADVILTNRTLEELARAGIEPGPKTIFHRVTPFARGGLYEEIGGAPILLEAASGFLVCNGDPAREPVRMPGNIVSYVVGVHASVATLSAVIKRIATGAIESIETSQLDALTTTVPFVRSQYMERADERHGGPATGVRLYPIGNGRISGNLLDPVTFSYVLAELGVAEEAILLDLDTPEKRRNLAKLSDFLNRASQHCDPERVFEGVMERGAPRFGLFQTPHDLVHNRQVESLDFIKKIPDSTGAMSIFPGLPAKMQTYAPPDLRLAQRVKTYRWEGVRLPSPSGSRGERPLQGIRVVDFTQAWIGPFATMMLADLGADVIKVESHKRVDVWRNWRGTLPEGCVRNANAHVYNVGPNFNGTNRNKREIAIDLNHHDGVGVAKDLIASADVVMSNFTPHVMRKFDLDFDSLRNVKPDIVYVCWSGYGEVGPYRDYKANGATIEAMAGWDALFGYRENDPMVMGFYQTDAFTGLQMATCALIGVINRDLTGEAQNVRGSMLESAIGYIGEEIIAAGKDEPLVRWGNRHPDYAPYGVFPTIESDQWIAIACLNDEEWCRLKTLIGLDSSEFDSATERLRHVDAVEELVTSWSRNQTRDMASGLLRNAGVPVVVVVDCLEILDHPEFTRRSWFQKQSHPDVRDMWYGGFAWRFSDSELTADRPSPRLGEHTEEVLRELGYSSDRIDELFVNDTVGCVLEFSDEATE
ncbi:MAG: CoA transferase [Gammaproteobacteria bacterium]|nr:CoA transferase [Gammaproteobacteria bacterium]